MILGIVLGDVVGGLILAGTGSLHGGPTLARVGKGGVIILAVFMSLQQLGVATDIVTTAFAIIFGAIALALALSFGLGNRELAGEITRAWYERYKAERDAIDQEVEGRGDGGGTARTTSRAAPRAPVHTPVTVRATDHAETALSARRFSLVFFERKFVENRGSAR